MAVSRKGKIVIASVVGIVLLAVIIISVFATRKDTPEVTVVKIEPKRELKSTVTASGEIRPIQFINLTSEVQGRIEEIYVKEGDTVTQGQSLVRLDPNQFESSTDAQTASLQAAQNETQVSRSQVLAAQNQYSLQQQSLTASQASINTAYQQVIAAQQSVESAKQQVIAAQTDIDQAQVNLDSANRELKRSADLVEKNVAPKQEYDQNRDKAKTAEVALRAAQSRLKSAQISVNVAQTNVNEAQSRYNESKARAKQQQVAVQDAKRGVDTANLSADTSAKRAEQQAAILRGQKSQRDKTLQIAPINGIIADIPSKVGTFAVAGLSTTPLLTIADMSTVNVEVKVDETQIDNVAVGQPVKVKVDALGDQEIGGTVRQKTPLAVGKSQTTGGLSTNINTNEAKEFRVVIELSSLSDENKSALRPGMSATAVITTKTQQNVLAVPLQSVITKKPDAAPSPTVNGDSPAAAPEKVKDIKGVYVLDGNKAKFKEVTTGIVGDSDIQITGGLSENEEVITGPSRVLNTLKEDTTVKRQAKTDAANKS